MNPGNISNLDGLIWLLVLLLPFLFMQRRLHKEIQAVLLLLTRRSDIAIALFSVLFFPGVLLHETSHLLMARLLGVRTGRFSLLPRPLEDGRLQLGFVETAKADILRDALIGAAPLITGGLLVAHVGIFQLGLSDAWLSLSAAAGAAFFPAIRQIFLRPDFWLWFYLLVAVSSTMLPSRADQRAWLPVTLVVGILLVIGLIAGVGPWLLDNMAVPFNSAMRAIASVFAISLAVHVALVPPFVLFRVILERLTGFEVV